MTNDLNDNNSADQQELVGTVEHIIYQNEDNGYCVCEMGTDSDGLVTIVGEIPYISVAETMRVVGKWVFHQTFGRQFRVEYYEKQLPADENSIIKYLSSGAVRGIGPVTAMKIVGQYGIDTFDVLENHPEWLSDIPGISRKKAYAISEEFKAQFGLRSVMMFCREFFGPNTAVKVYKRWGGSAIDVIKHNPYILCDEISGIGFEKADNIASMLGIENYAEERIAAAIKHTLSFNANQNGHVFLPRNKLVDAAREMLDIDDIQAENAVDSLIKDGSVVETTLGGRKCIYLKRYYEAEKYIATKLDMLDKVCPRLDVNDIDKFILMIQRELGIEYASMQKKAIRNSVNNGVMVLTGGPGTGKTTVIRAVIRVFSELGFKIALAAPTGRAAKRMSESTGSEAKTIHRLLEMEYSGETNAVFRRNENALLDENVIIVDEASMIDTLLMASLLKAIKPGAHLLLIGDADQLLAVGAGSVLNDIIECGRFNTVELKEIFRQAGESLIVTNAHAINAGEYPEIDTKNNDFFFLHRATDEEIVRTITELCAIRLPRTYGEKIRNDIQVVAPSRKGGAGTEMLNRRLQAILNPPNNHKNEIKMRDIVFREGDKVMQIKNNYDILWKSGDKDGVGVFNGDIGKILEIDRRNETMTIVFDEDRVAEYDLALCDQLEHAYAITVHKSQGSGATRSLVKS